MSTVSTSPATPDPHKNFGFLLKDVTRLYSLNFERHAVPLKLTLTQCKILGYLQRHEGVSQSRLAELTDTDPMTLGRLLERMEGEGLLERRTDPTDARARSLYLQAAATPVLQEIWRLSDRSRAEALAGLATAERNQLVKLLQHIHANLDDLIPGAADAGHKRPAHTTEATHP